MTTFRRWVIVACLVVLVIGVPVGLRAIPPGDQDVSAAALLKRIEASSAQAWSGYVETRGALALPVAGSLTGVGDLLGDKTRLRVWWRGKDDWRVDRLLSTGEIDLVHDANQTAQWTYEDTSVDLSIDPDIRLPRSADLLPPTLGARVLQDVDATELERLAPRRVAGRDALGLRVFPGAPQSSIDHVDLWADGASGVPLRLEVYGVADAAGNPAFTSAFRDFDDQTPEAGLTSFTPPPGADVKVDGVLDIADAANQYAPVIAPPTLAGLPKNENADRAVGVYGTGVTQVLAVPLQGREAGPLRDQVASTPGSRLVNNRAGAGVIAAVGPLSVLVTGSGSESGWLLAGTVTAETLVAGIEDVNTRTHYAYPR